MDTETQAPEQALPMPTREFGINPQSGKPAVVHRNYEDIELEELTEGLAEAEEKAQRLEKDAKEARRYADTLKSEVARFTEIAQRAGAEPPTEADGGEETTGDPESDQAVDL